MINLRVKEVAKSKGYKLKDLYTYLGITQNSFHLRLKNPKLSTLEEVADFLKVDIIELLEPTEHYSHFYDSKGQWLGVRKK